MQPRRIGYFIIFLTIAIISTVFVVRYVQNRFSPAILVPLDNSPYVSPRNPPPPQSILNSKPTVPNSLLLKVLFTPQAPTANWDELHNEACEEASMIMAQGYFNPDSDHDKNNDGKLDPEFVEAEIEKLTVWEKQKYGYYLDINSKETVEVLKNVYGLNAEIRTEYTEQDIKQALAENKLILFPVQGQQLSNPNFRRPGPPYHMLVIKGYTKYNFITNDPGTRLGASYPYTFDTLYKANGEWQHDTHSVDTSKKMIIIVSE